MVLELTSCASKRLYTNQRYKFDTGEIKKLFEIAMIIGIGNKATYTMIGLFVETTNMDVQPDMLLVFSACISLACKIHSNEPSIEQIFNTTMKYLEIPELPDCSNITQKMLREAQRFQLAILSFMKFSICTDNPYSFIEEMPKIIKYTDEDNACVFLFINDIIQNTMIQKSFTAEEIAYSGLLAFYMIFPEKLLGVSENCDDYAILNRFQEVFKLENWEVDTACFISHQIFELYESR